MHLSTQRKALVLICGLELSGCRQFNFPLGSRSAPSTPQPQEAPNTSNNPEHGAPGATGIASAKQPPAGAGGASQAPANSADGGKSAVSLSAIPPAHAIVKGGQPQAGIFCDPTFSESLLNRLTNVFGLNDDCHGSLVDPAEHSGKAAVVSARGRISFDGPFFQSLGSNGRSCASCHDLRAGMGLTPALTQQLFDLSAGLAPVFRANDGANAPNLDISTLAARRLAFSMLLAKAVIRVGLPLPAGAEFTVAAIDDPYGFASASELSLFRRPLPSTNLGFLTTVMWDGRETLVNKQTSEDLEQQASDATVGHAEGHPLEGDLRRQIVAFELDLFAAQMSTASAGTLDGGGASGGPFRLIQQNFKPGMNSPLAPGFDRHVFSLFDPWENHHDEGKAAINRGQKLFNTRQFTIQDVKGLNDLAHKPQIQGTCSGCHNTPNVGNSSIGSMMDLGLSSERLRSPDLPLYTLRRLSTGEIVRTSDPGRAMVTGKWADIGRFKVPVLRDLATRPPYFHNGAIDTLAGVVDFYNNRFNIGLTNQEKADLAAFLGAL